MDKKAILKKYTGKGGIVTDTIKEIPGTVSRGIKNMGKGIKTGIKWAGNQVAKDLKIGDQPGNKTRATMAAEVAERSGLYTPEKKAIAKGAVKGAMKAFPKTMPLNAPKRMPASMIKRMPKTIVDGKALRPQVKPNTAPKGWDSVTYRNFKRANPNLEPDAEDTMRMRNAR